jgi:uncharacterized protein involved in exopolysaccharide biosynthesis
MTLATRLSDSRANADRTRSDASLKKEERAKEGAKAMLEYQANSRMVRERMAQLRALRLAKEAADKGRQVVDGKIAGGGVRRGKGGKAAP